MTAAAPHLFAPLPLRGLTLRNRIVCSPMCQYSSTEGRLDDWHLVHLGARATGGAGLVLTEATAVEPRGRITPWCAGLWDDAQVEPLARVARFVKGQGTAFGVQLAHAGRKGSTRRPWDGGGPLPPGDPAAWETVAPSPLPFQPGGPPPRALDEAGVRGLIAAFAAAARRAAVAGCDLVEVHAAHGYLLHQFLSPLSNQRADAWGGDLRGRARLLLEVVRAVRAAWPAERPVLVRVSASDGAAGGLEPGDLVEVARWLAAEGVDAVDVSSGGLTPAQRIPVGPGYQVPFAARLRREAGVPTVAVGLITDPRQADAIVREGQADLVALARELLRDPSWPQRAAKALGQPAPIPPQYLRAHA